MILKQKRHVCLFAAAWIFGVVCAGRRERVWIPILCLLGLILFFGIATGKKRRERIVVAGIVLALAAAAFSVCVLREHRNDVIQASIKTSPGSEISGRVIQKQIKSDQCLYYLKTPYKKVIVYDETDGIPIGSEVTAYGKWKAFSGASNEGSFDLARDYRDQNISFRVFADEMKVQQVPHFRLREGLYRLQKRISAVYGDSLNEREAGVLATLTVGDKSRMDPEVRALYQQAGLSHILAISGLHISILGFGLYRFLRKVRLPCHLCEGIGCAVIVCFVVMSGMSVSALRALIMYLLLMGAYGTGRTYDPPCALSIAALVLLIPNPANLYRSGFQFSFLAMASIVLYSAVAQKAAEKKEENEKEKGPFARFGGAVKGRLVSGAFLQLMMLPMTAWCYYEVPVCALFLNLLLLPLCSALLGFGLAGGIFGIVFPQAGKWLLIPCHVILKVYEQSVLLIDRLPFSTWITGQPSAFLLLAFYTAVAGLCLLYLSGREKEIRHFSRFALLPAALFSCILFLPERQYCRIDVLDVGQGDGIFLSDGAGGRVMIDGGSSSESGVGTYEIEPFLKVHGIRGIDAWIVTHGDLDHYSGLLEVLEDGYRVDTLVLAEAMPHDETWEELTAVAEANKTEVVYVEAGDQILLEDAKMTCLYPAAKDAEEADPEEANEFSQVWTFQKEEMRALFTGDLGEEQERLLLERGVLSDCVVLKVAHHGSKYSSCAEFLEAVSPEYAVISCAAKNIYGHPAPETLERLADAGCEVYQTPQCGQITFYEKRGRWKLRRFLFRKTEETDNNKYQCEYD